jgi:hypothetical protein
MYERCTYNSTYTQYQNQCWNTNHHNVCKNACEYFHYDITIVIKTNAANMVITPSTKYIINLSKHDKA